jgi:hypothetical protein
MTEELDMTSRLDQPIRSVKRWGPTRNRSRIRGSVPVDARLTEDAISVENCALEAESACSVTSQIVETDFAELSDGALVDLVQDSENPRRTLFAVWKDGELSYLDRLEHDGHVLVPLQRKNELFNRHRLPTEARPYESVQILLSRIELLISRCISVNSIYFPVLADFVMSTWLVDRFEVAPYLSVVGLPQSGKTTLLKLLSLICRRSLLIADITSASFYQACAQFMPTMIIDEAGTFRNNSALRHILRAGSTRDVDSVQANHTFHAYGAKVISWLEPPNDMALNSRCVLIPMCETLRTDLARPNDAEVKQEAVTLQVQLLQFRFENYWSVEPTPVPGDEILRPRSRDLLRVLTAGHSRDVDRSRRLLEFIDSGQAVPQEPLSPEQDAVLRCLHTFIHLREEFKFVLTGDLTKMVNIFLRVTGKNLSMKPRKVGAVMTSLGFSNRARTNAGWIMSLNHEDAKKVHHLAEYYGIEKVEGALKMRLELRDDCDLCRAAKATRHSPILPSPEGS